VLPALIELIDRPELANERGTLVYCLANFDCLRHFLRLVRLVCYGNWEVAYEAMGVLAEMDNVETEGVKQGYDLLVINVDAGVSDEWRAKLLADLLSMFD